MYKQDGVRIGVNVLVDLSAELLTPVNSFAEMSLTSEIFVFFFNKNYDSEYTKDNFIAAHCQYPAFFYSVAATNYKDFFSWHGFTTVPSLSRIGPPPNFRLNRAGCSAQQSRTL
jgi:hypothetical protein